MVADTHGARDVLAEPGGGVQDLAPVTAVLKGALERVLHGSQPLVAGGVGLVRSLQIDFPRQRIGTTISIEIISIKSHSENDNGSDRERNEGERRGRGSTCQDALPPLRDILCCCTQLIGKLVFLLETGGRLHTHNRCARCPGSPGGLPLAHLKANCHLEYEELSTRSFRGCFYNRIRQWELQGS